VPGATGVGLGVVHVRGGGGRGAIPLHAQLRTQVLIGQQFRGIGCSWRFDSRESQSHGR
jgi:hypothetical protein